MIKAKLRHRGVHDLTLCGVCTQGACCRDGVEVDLFEVARILQKPLDMPKPWFEYLGQDRRFASGFKFSTLLKRRRCIFQDKDRRCRIYEIRPQFCAEFPLENGRPAPYYRALCHRAKKRRGR